MDPLMRDQGSASPGPRPGGANAASLVTYFQPFYNLRDDRLQGLEALARLHSAQTGQTELPSEFFASTAASGSMRGLDLRVLDDALTQVAEWRSSPRSGALILAVNLSWDLVGDPGVVDDITWALQRHGVPGDRLLVDLSTDTFRRLTTGDEQVLDRLRELQRLEITFCIDGFTAADLDILPAALRVPVDIIKLRPEQLALESRTRAALAELAGAIQDAGLPVVAAGVETPEQLELVRELGFEWAQGFLLGEPVPAERALDHPGSLTSP